MTIIDAIAKGLLEGCMTSAFNNSSISFCKASRNWRDITSSGDLRIDGTLIGNIICSSKVIIGANGVVEGDISGQQADIMGKVTGTIKVKELLMLKSNCLVNGNLHSAKLQIEPAAQFNGQCHMIQEQPAGQSSKPGQVSSPKTDFSKSPALAI